MGTMTLTDHLRAAGALIVDEEAALNRARTEAASLAYEARAAGMSITQIARLLHVTRATVYAWTQV